MDINTILTFGSIAILLLIVLISIFIAVRRKPEEDLDKLTTMEQVVEHIKQTLVELDKDDYSLSVIANNSMFERAYRRKGRIRDAYEMRFFYKNVYQRGLLLEQLCGKDLPELHEAYSQLQTVLNRKGVTINDLCNESSC